MIMKTGRPKAYPSTRCSGDQCGVSGPFCRRFQHHSRPPDIGVRLSARHRLAERGVRYGVLRVPLGGKPLALLPKFGGPGAGCRRLFARARLFQLRAEIAQPRDHHRRRRPPAPARRARPDSPARSPPRPTAPTRDECPRPAPALPARCASRRPTQTHRASHRRAQRWSCSVSVQLFRRRAFSPAYSWKTTDVRTFCFVPEGQLIIAQRFIAGLVILNG